LLLIIIIITKIILTK